MNPEPQTLLIDADDTLWENNVYFERVAGEFLERLAGRGVPLARSQRVLWETEQRNVAITGYGSNAFCRSLHEVARELGAADLEPWIADQEQGIYGHPIQLMPGVAETLPLLHARHRLILFSKGREDEQRGKLERSGLGSWFHAVEIAFEKSVDSYRAVLDRHRLEPERTWMIGNSPRSDINPAKAAGLRTVFIPYHTTWQHEIEEINPAGPETLMLESFGDLAGYFGS